MAKKKTTKKATKTTRAKALKTNKKKATPKKTAPKLVAKAKKAVKKKATKKTATNKPVAWKKSATPKNAKNKKAEAKTTAPKLASVVNQVTTSAMAVESVQVGETVPNFELDATGGQKVSLESLRGKKVVLYFYPKDSTPGCTLEGHDFTKLHQQFKELGAEVYGVSRDDIKSHEKFKANQNYSVDLLSDSQGELCNTFGVIKDKNMYGKMVKGIERSTFVIDPDGRLAHEWRKVQVDGHAQEVLEFLRGL